MNHDNLELTSRYYGVGAIPNILLKTGAALSVTFLLMANLGTADARKEICFYPQSAKIHDADVRLTGKGEQLFGSKYCRAEHLAIIPSEKINQQKNESSNPAINKWARLNNADTYTMREIDPDNLYKALFGGLSVIAGACLIGVNKRVLDNLNLLRPQYRATQQLAGVRSAIALKTQEQILQLSSEEIIKYWRGIAVAEAKQIFIQNLTINQANLLFTAMTAEEYEQWGHIIDGGQSFNKFITQQPIPDGCPDASGHQPEAVTESEGTGQDKYHWLNHPVSYPTLVFGGMGAGKSWTTREIVYRKVQAGQQIFVLDPHGSRVEWQGVNFIRSYEDIADFMVWYQQEMRQRYSDFDASGLTEDEWTKHLEDDGKAISFVAEEFTTWADNIAEPKPSDSPSNWKPDPDFIGKFFKCAMTESRKQLMTPLFVAHDRTLEILGKAKGLSAMRDSSLLEIELLAKIDPVSTKAVSSGMGRIKLPGHIQNWLTIELPKLEKKRTDFRQDTPSQLTRKSLEELWKKEVEEPIFIPPKNSLSPMAQSLYDYLMRTERIIADVKEFKGNFKVNRERFPTEQLKTWMHEIVGAGFAEWVSEGVIKLHID